MRKPLKTLPFIAVSLMLIAVQASVAKLPIDAFAMLPIIQNVQVSPDGKRLGILRATSKHGGYILEVYNTRKMKTKPVKLGADKMELTNFGWINNSRLHVSFRQRKATDQGGGSYWAYIDAIVNADGSGKWMYLPTPKVGGVSIVSYLRSKPDTILLAYETDDTYYYNADIVLFNVRTGRKNIVIKANSKLGSFGIDLDGEVRSAQGFDTTASAILFYLREKGSKDWKLIKKVTPDAKTREDFSFLGFSYENPNEIYVVTNNGEDKAGIYILDITTNSLSERQFGLKSVDVDGIIRSDKPGDLGRVLGFTYMTGQSKRYYVDEGEKVLYKSIGDLFPKEKARIISRSDDDNVMVIYVSSDKNPGSFHLLLNRSQLTLLGKQFPLLTKNSLARVKYIKYKARDGRKIPAYITVPNGKPPFPAVVLPHGGPWVRDTDRWDGWSQFLAHQGYIVIRPNYRGSTGYGLDHWKAGDKNWGLKMQDDLDDAALYLVKKGLSSKDKLAIFGWSYGGYAAFAAAVRKNSIYQCAIAGAGVSNLSLLNAGLAGNPFLRKLQRPTIAGISPIEHVKDIAIPIFVVHGAIDQRVPVSHSRQFVSELKKYKKDYKYSEIKGLDHFSDTFDYNHKTRFYSEMADYLASNKCFGFD